MRKSIILTTILIIINISCTHFVPISSTEVYSNNYKFVSKVKFKNDRELEIENINSNFIILQDSILVIKNDSTKIEILNEEVVQYYQSKFSFGKTAAFVTGIVLIPTALAYLLFLQLYDN